MLTKRIIPCMDILGRRIVKGVQFSNLTDSGDPAQKARLYEAQGADEIVVLDISATLEDRESNLDVVRSVRDAVSIPVTAGGGIRELKDIERLLLNGADKVSINSAAVKSPSLIKEASERFGRQCIVLAIDAAENQNLPSGFEVLVNSGKKKTSMGAIFWAKKAESLGAGEILLTGFNRDGTGSGYELSLLKAVCRNVNIPVIASGGAKDASDMLSAFQEGADAVLAAGMFHRGETTIGQVKDFLFRSNIPVRLN